LARKREHGLALKFFEPVERHVNAVTKGILLFKQLSGGDVTNYARNSDVKTAENDVVAVVFDECQDLVTFLELRGAGDVSVNQRVCQALVGVSQHGFIHSQSLRERLLENNLVKVLPHALKDVL